MGRIFVSYTKDDRPIAAALFSHLKSKGCDIWLDEDTTTPGDSIPLRISDGIKFCETFLLIISKNYLASRWCIRELNAIILNSVNNSKKIIVIQVDGAPVPDIIADLHKIKYRTDLLNDFTNLTDNLSTIGKRLSFSPESLVDLVFEAERKSNYGAHLITKEMLQPLDSPENDGLVFIKPGGTFFKPCLSEIFRRLLGKCRIRQLRLFTGDLIKERGLFDKQYIDPLIVAKGLISPTQEELNQIRAIYNKPEFEEQFGIAYSDDLITPAFQLTDNPYNLRPELITELWDQGRSYEKFWNKRWDGLNKVSYHTSVFPICFPQIQPPKVRIVLNGFVFGYKQFLEQLDSRVVAVHISTKEPWINIKTYLTGPHNNPLACPEGSIRRDAYEGILPLNPKDNLVNGQRNVIHCSGTDYDGIKELTIWFEYLPSDTFAGQIYNL